jgi:hypothetical protein
MNSPRGKINSFDRAALERFMCQNKLNNKIRSANRQRSAYGARTMQFITSIRRHETILQARRRVGFAISTMTSLIMATPTTRRELTRPCQPRGQRHTAGHTSGNTLRLLRIRPRHQRTSQLFRAWSRGRIRQPGAREIHFSVSGTFRQLAS